MAARTHNVEEERDLAGRLAGVLFLTAGVTALVLLLVPGIENAHRNWVVALAAVCMAWGLFCVALAKPERHGPWFWHAPAIGSLFIVARRCGLDRRRGLPGALLPLLPAVLRDGLLPAPRRAPVRARLRGRGARAAAPTTRGAVDAGVHRRADRRLPGLRGARPADRQGQGAARGPARARRGAGAARPAHRPPEPARDARVAQPSRPSASRAPG